MTDIEHRHLRSALDFAVMIAAEGQKRRPPIPFPKELKPFFNKRRVPTSALGRVRRAIESDAEFRRVLSHGAIPELVDEVGRLWLTQPAGWEVEVASLIAAADEAKASRDAVQALKRAEKRRDAAELAAVRTRAELVQRDEIIAGHATEIDELRAELAKVAEEAAELRAELIDSRNEVRHARDRERAAAGKLEAAIRDRDRALDDRRDATAVRDDVLATRVDSIGSVVEIAQITEAAEAAQALANRLESLLPQQPDDAASEAIARPAQRTPMSLPGGVLSSSAEAGEHFARSDAAIVVDGYNVSKLAWQSRTLEQQRSALLDAVENLARRFGTDITVIFDGASIVGAHAARRRLVRVVYSPEGVIADDLIRDEVRRLPTSRAVVVVTNDNEIIRDVRAEGANTLPSNAFIAIL
jgi:YacP-like NYN domain